VFELWGRLYARSISGPDAGLADARLAVVPDFPPPTQRVIEAAARKGVQLDVVLFEESTHTAAEAATAVGAEVGQIVKSLVFVAPGVDPETDGLRPCLVLVSGANTVDLALLSAALTEPNMRRATADEARELTGFSIGGIPPFGHRQAIRTVMDPDLARYETIWAAAGTANAVFPVSPATLRVLANAVVTPVTVVRQAPSEQHAAGASTGA